MPPHPVSHPLRASVRALLREARDILVSLRLTIVLLVFSMVLVFAGTLEQVDLGIWAVQEKYFRSFAIYAQAGPLRLPIFPGGYTIGGLLLANLVAAHLVRFAFAWRKAGIFLTHFGLIVLLVGELLSGLWHKDFHLRLNEGETKNYAESSRHYELVLIDQTDPATDEVVAIPESLLARQPSLQHPRLPFRLVVKAYYPNSALHLRTADVAPSDAAAAPVSAGMSDHVTAVPLPVTHRTDEANLPSAIVELAGAAGSLGTCLASAHLTGLQTFAHEGRTWALALRPKRAYQPFSLTLLKFSHDRYAGTDIPKNFSSRLRLGTPGGRDDREVLVYMNNPLRHGGLTFYQAGFANNDRTTILQVVRNPSWLVPYVACGLMTLGMTVQFGLHLVGFVRRRAGVASRAADAEGASASAGVIPSAARTVAASENPARLPVPTHP